MFADALLDSHHQSRRGWATLTSFGIQAIFIACLLILPLLYTQVLPRIRENARTAIVPFGSPVVRQPASAQPSEGRTSVFTVARPDMIMARATKHGANSDSGIEAPNIPIGDPYSHVGIGSPTGVWHALDQAVVRVTPPPASVTTREPRRSVMMEGSLIHRVDPIYPSLARAARIQGTVILAAVIGRDGSVQHLQIMSGHPLLTAAAIDAVRQWRYRPYLLNGEAIEVDTQVTVNFILAR